MRPIWAHAFILDFSTVANGKVDTRLILKFEMHTRRQTDGQLSTYRTGVSMLTKIRSLNMCPHIGKHFTLQLFQTLTADSRVDRHTASTNRQVDSALQITTQADKQIGKY
jgi:hypothetical protein